MHFFVWQNALKLTYSNVDIQKFPGGETPGPPAQKGAPSNTARGARGGSRV